MESVSLKNALGPNEKLIKCKNCMEPIIVEIEDDEKDTLQ
jgi:hypothetical protein